MREICRALEAQKFMDLAVVESHKIGGQTFELRAVPCGKKNCSKCPHGPYWYLRIRLRDGREVKRYLGKTEPAEIAEARRRG